ncbi:glycosyltransferase family 2 protein [Fusobacterium sp. THCT1E2]
MLVSIVMPVFNGEKYLKEAIESILEQTYTDFEFLIINDGSTDNSLNIIKEYQNIDKRICLINNEKNKGIVYSLNKGLLESKGKYILRMDCDDISFFNRLERQILFMEKNRHIGISGTWVKINKNGKYREYKNKIKFSAIKAGLIFNNMLVHPTFIIRKEFFKKYDLSYNKEFNGCEDYGILIDGIKYFQIEILPEVLFEYRINEIGITQVLNKKLKEKYINLKRIYIKILQNIFEEQDLTEKDLKIHFEFTNNVSNFNFSLIELRKYLNKLTKANKNKKYLSSKELLYAIGKRWIKLGIKNKQILKKSFFEYLISKYFFYGCVDICREVINDKIIVIKNRKSNVTRNRNI